MLVNVRPLSICVLGGTGFVGAEVVARLARAGHSVRVLTRNLDRGRHLLVLPEVELRVADVHHPAALAREFTGRDVAINLVGILNEPGRSGAGFRRVHAELARKVVEAARAQRVARLLHMSSLGADAERAPSHYLRSKGDAEGHVRAGGATGLDFTIFRPSVIFGSGDSLTNRFARLLRLSGGWLPLAKPRARLAPVWIEDVASAFMAALHGGAKTSGRTFELCGPEIVTLEELARFTAAAAQLPCHIVSLPDPIARVQAFVMDFVPGKPLSTDNLRSLSVDSVCRDNGFAQLGIEPSPMSAVVPAYLGPGERSHRLDRFRRRA
jgi:NADH dehydrogenase